MPQSIEKTHPFVWKYKETFRAKYEEMCRHDSAYIVTIARKGPRLFDLFEDVVDFDHNPTIVSDRAIPYLDFTKAKELPLFDDIVIFGSTMNDRMQELKEVGASPQPYSLACSIDEAAINVNYGEALRKERVADFCDDIVGAFQLVGKPFDIDHPIFTLNLIGLDTFKTFAESMESQVENLQYFADMTNSLQRNNGVLNLVYAYPPQFSLQSLFNSQICRVRPSNLYKIRIFHQKSKGRASITPMLVFSVSFKENVDGPIFTQRFSYLNEVVNEAKEIFLRRNSSSEKIEEMLYRLIFFLVEYLYGISILSTFDFFSGEIRLGRRDCYYVFGDNLGEYLIRMLESKRTRIVSDLLSLKYSASKNRQGAEGIENKELFQELFYDEKNAEINKVMTWSNEIYSVWNICRLMKAKDMLTRKPEALHTPGRLKFGLTFEDLLSILKIKMGRIEPEVLSNEIDYFVDRGVLIPIFLKYQTNYWVRAYRFGENFGGYPEERRSYFVRNALERLFNVMKVDHISQFDFEKLFAYLIQVFSKTGSRISPTSFLEFKEFDFGIAFDEFGARPISKGFRSMPADKRKMGIIERRFLFQEAEENKVIKISRKGISLNNEFYVLHSEFSNPLSRIIPRVNIYTDLWTKLAYNRKIWPRKDDIMLLLTTCNKKSNFLSAYKTGIYSWFFHDHSRFSKIMNEVKLALNLKSKDSREFTLKVDLISNLLHDNAVRLRQSENKRRLWERREEVIRKIDQEFSRKPLIEPLWQEVKGLKFDVPYFSEKEQFSYGYLKRFYEIARASTNVLRSALVEREKGEFQEYVNSYNSVIARAGFLPSLSEIKEEDRISVIEALEHNYSTLVQYFKLLVEDREESLSDLRELDHDVAIVMYDIMDYSEQGEAKRDETTNNVALRMKDLLETMGEGKFHRCVLDDANALVLGSIQNTLKSTENLIEIMREKKMYSRIAIHYTDPNTRIKYMESQPKVAGGTPFIICGRLKEFARKAQREKTKEGIFENVILMTRSAYEKLSEDVKTGLEPRGPYKSEPMKGVGEIEYWQIDETKLFEFFGP